MAHVKAGTLIALGVTSRERSPVAPDLPTIAESGYPGFDALAWHGIMAPAATPAAIIKRLNVEIVKALKDPDTAKLIEAQAIQIVASTPEEFAAFIKKDVVLWKDVARQAKIEVK
jgi:tripartite-type tricarboxylate transporter receptor subunit TctC